ncbi:MAG: hypothetical protein IJU20_08500 [Clostridia bacterium]|nr:hypothetical protein [Clostridia bacterium]
MKIKLLSLFLLTVLILGLLCSCGAQSGKDGETSANPETNPQNNQTETDRSDETKPETETRILPSIPASYDFGGETFTFGAWEADGVWADTVRLYRDLYSDEPSGDLVKDQVFYRNSRISQNYKVEIAQELFPYVEFMNKLSMAVSSGAHEWNAVLPMLLTDPQLITKDLFLNLHEVPHMDLSKPWYDQSAMEQLEVIDTLYLVPCAINVNDKDATAAIAFNKALAEDYQISSAELYNLARNGKWTLEALSKYCEGIHEDTNNDGKMDENDFYGFLGKHDVAPSFKDGADSHFVTKDSDGFYEFTFGDVRDYDLTEDILNFMHSDFFFNHHEAGIDDPAFTRMFMNGQGIFFWIRMDEITTMRGSEVEFGLLPTPKYEESQDFYSSYVSKNTTGILHILKTITGAQLDLTGMIVEALAADSYYDVQKAYVEDSLQRKYVHDSESSDMVPLIFEHRIFDPGDIYNFGDIGNKYLFIAQNQGSGVLSSMLAGIEGKIDSEIRTFNEKIEDIAF